MTITRMTVAEFRRLGLLQEVNRRLLHPMGLALEVVVDDDGSERFGEVWDYRDDPEGIAFAEGDCDREFEYYASRLIAAHRGARLKLFGAIVQPIDAARAEAPGPAQEGE